MINLIDVLVTEGHLDSDTKSDAPRCCECGSITTTLNTREFHGACSDGCYLEFINYDGWDGKLD